MKACRKHLGRLAPSFNWGIEYKYENWRTIADKLKKTALMRQN